MPMHAGIKGSARGERERMAGRNNLTTTTTGGIDEKRPPPSNLSLFLTFPAASAATKRATTTRVSDSVVSMSCGDMVARALERRGKGERMSLFSFGDRREESEKSEAATLASKLFFPSHSLPLSLSLSLSLFGEERETTGVIAAPRASTLSPHAHCKYGRRRGGRQREAPAQQAAGEISSREHSFRLRRFVISLFPFPLSHLLSSS